MKVKEVLKKGIAGLMTAAMLVGNSGFVLAADEAEEDTAVEEAVTEEYSSDEATAEENEADSGETVRGVGESRQRGDGTLDDPWNLAYDEDVDGLLGLTGDYYFIETKDDGILSIQGCVPDGNAIPSGWITVWDSNGSVCLDDVVKGGDEYGFSTAEKKSFGVKAGERFLLRFYKAHENGYKVYRVKTGFEKSDLWEAEPDSENSPKKIDLNKEYNGVIINKSGDEVVRDYADYYMFSLKKKGTVELWLNSAWASHIDLFKKNYKEDNKIEHAFNNSGNEAVITKSLAAGDYCIRIDTAGTSWTEYKLKVAAKDDAGKSSPETGTAVIMEKDGYESVEVHSLKEAFGKMTEAKDYIVELKSDMVGEKPLSIPKKPASVTLYGNGHSIVIKGNKITSNSPLTLEDVVIKTVHSKKEGVPEKLSLNAKSGLTINSGVAFDGKSVKIQVKKDMVLAGTLSANTLIADKFTLEAGAVYNVGSGDRFTVNKELIGKEGSGIYLYKGFKPLVLKGKATGMLTFNSDEDLADGTQVISCSKKNMTGDNLRGVFDCTGLTANDVPTYLCFYKGKACLFGESIEFGGSQYCLWTDAVSAMNTNLKSGEKELSIKLIGDVNMMGKFLLPKKGYELLTINGNGHSLTFTSDIKLTGNLTVTDDTALIKVNKKNEKVSGKVKEGKFKYNGPGISE